MAKNETSLFNLLLLPLLGLAASANERQVCAGTDGRTCKSLDSWTTSMEEQKSHGLELVQLKGHKVPGQKDPKQDAQYGKLLFMTAVGSNPESMDLIIRGVNHLRKSYNGTVDVFLMHYDKTNKHWLDHDRDWYLGNVQKSSRIPGIKFSLVSKVITNFRDIRGYSWIWVMDDDVDITQTNVSKLIRLAEESGSPIVGPAIDHPPLQPGQIPNKRWAPVGRNENVLQDRMNESAQTNSWARHYCKPGDPICRYQQADLNCRFSYTQIIEVMTPLFRPQALWQMIHECEGCISDESIWGIDLIWCSLSAKLYGLPTDKGCALIDRASVVHTDKQTLPKYDPQEQARIQGTNSAQLDRVAASYPDDINWASFAWKPKCVY
mmetsp:Transcript_98144/g.184567  ORF Transcript_98144/g.184567 Transcript_98144/m.184567 type:complete len:378 (+) Transcript_98144:35-1168(+)